MFMGLIVAKSGIRTLGFDKDRTCSHAGTITLKLDAGALFGVASMSTSVRWLSLIEARYGCGRSAPVSVVL